MVFLIFIVYSILVLFNRVGVIGCLLKLEGIVVLYFLEGWGVGVREF